jgi:glycosyltransferase domain-containing protein
VADSLLQRLTIIIPTVSRPTFVLRQFEYWRNTGPQVFILDGARTPIEIPAEFHADNMHYVHTGTKFNERLSTAGQYVKTEFCALLPDDEFFLFDGLRAAISHLDKNREVIGCVGRCLYFFVDQGRFLVTDAYRDWKPFPDSVTSVADRLDVDLPPNKTHKAQFGVFRAEVWIKMFEVSYKTYYSCGYTYERLLNLERTLLGRSDILEDLLWMRSMENPPISNESVPRVGGRDFVSWALNPDFTTEINEYRAIARSVIQEGGLTEQEVMNFEERFFHGGIRRQQEKEARNTKSWSKRLGKVAMFQTPKPIRVLAKRILPNRLLKFTGWQGFTLDAMCKSLSERGTHFEQTELDRVAELALKLDANLRQA